MGHFGQIEYIDLADCVHSGLYRVRSQHFAVAVFNKETSGFIGIQSKHGNEMPFSEMHYDHNKWFGNALPLELLEMCSLTSLHSGSPIQSVWIINQELLDYLREAEAKYLQPSSSQPALEAS